MTRQKVHTPQDLLAWHARLNAERDPNKVIIAVCAGTGCLACGCAPVAEAFREAVRKDNLEHEVEIKTTGCHGFCERGPLALIQPRGIFYQRLRPSDVKLVMDQTIKGDRLVNRLLYTHPKTKEPISLAKDIPFYEKQLRLIFGRNGSMDPTVIEDYIALGGYQPLVKALTTMTPEQIIAEVTKSGLRGRGGGGFPTGRKWASCRKAKGEPKYVICNADEGDPGAFMNRSLLEGNPHSVLEGMMIGSFALGSHEAFIYVRHEYPLAVKNLSIALDQARECGLLGENILGTGHSLNIEISRGGGAFVCGESTALMASLEGKVGEPRAKYIHTVDAGLYDKPSCLNNVETWANVPLIIEKGADWFASIGTTGSKGTKVFALTGKVNNTGLVEVPMGITLREVLYDIGGGVPGGKRFKAVQTGGPSGGTLIVETRETAVHDSMVAYGEIRDDQQVESLLDLPIDFDELTRVGSMMGSGGMIVMDEDSCMVDVAKYFLNFLTQESCGKCVPCREGLVVMHDILKRICDGQGTPDDIGRLEQLSQVIIDTSLCQLGGSAPNPVLSTIRYFRNEYMAHVVDKRCPAGVCKELVAHAINEKCNGCHACVKPCPTEAIIGKPKELHHVIQQKCIQCGACYQICTRDAINRVKRGEGDNIQRRARDQWSAPKQKQAAAAV